jgi:cyclopropane-fatty-acyl-phospholipid synthase
MTIGASGDVAMPATARRSGGIRGAILRRLCERLRCGGLVVIMPGGGRLEHRTGVAGPEATLVIHRWRMLRRLLLGGDVAFGEAYVDGDWSSPDPVALIALAACNEGALAPMTDGPLPARMLNRLMHRRRANTRAGSRRNIVEHYDLGNEFYAAWLDRSMSYSAALYRDPAMSLEAAQVAKQDRVIELLDPRPQHRVLEIGCGWGGLAHGLALRGSHVTALTLSPAQHDFAGTRLRAAGLSDRVQLRLQDYREVEGSFDRIVSIEMLEAVGEAYWPLYFDRLHALLKPGGVAVLQVITIADARFAAYRRRPDFIQRHVFPGGMLPSPQAIRVQLDRVGLRLGTVETFGMSYARTLDAWRTRFTAQWPGIAAQGFTPRFRRFWEYYLAYCEAGFRAEAIDVGLWRVHRPA